MQVYEETEDKTHVSEFGDAEVHTQAAPADVVLDLARPIDDRLRTFVANTEQMEDVLNRLSSMHDATNLSLTRKFLTEVVKHSDVPVYLRLKAAHSLEAHVEEEGPGKQACLESLSSLSVDHNVPFECRLEFLLYLLHSGNEATYEHAKDQLTAIIRGNEVSPEHKFKFVAVKANIPELYAEYFHSQGVPARWLVFCAQRLAEPLKHSKVLIPGRLFNNGTREEVIQKLTQIVCTPEETYADRSSALDTLSLFDVSPEDRERLLMYLAGGNLSISGPQGVHNLQMEDVTRSRLSKILNNSVFDKRSTDEEISELRTALVNIGADPTFLDSLFERIELDGTKTEGHSLKEVVADVWCIIRNHKHKEELTLRLLQEFQDSEDYCTSGYLTRLANVFVGIDDNFGSCLEPPDVVFPRIIKKKLQERIQHAENCEELLEEFLEPPSKRTKLNMFVAQHLDSLYNEVMPHFEFQIEGPELFRNAVQEFLYGEEEFEEASTKNEPVSEGSAARNFVPQAPRREQPRLRGRPQGSESVPAPPTQEEVERIENMKKVIKEVLNANGKSHLLETKEGKAKLPMCIAVHSEEIYSKFMLNTEVDKKKDPSSLYRDALEGAVASLQQ